MLVVRPIRHWLGIAYLAAVLCQNTKSGNSENRCEIGFESLTVIAAYAEETYLRKIVMAQ